MELQGGAKPLMTSGSYSLGDPKVRQIDPIQALPDGMIIDGERRWRAAGLVGKETLDAIITDLKLTQAQMATVRLTTFFHRVDLGPHEKWRAVADCLEQNPDWDQKRAAEEFKVDPVNRFTQRRSSVIRAKRSLSSWRPKNSNGNRRASMLKVKRRCTNITDGLKPRRRYKSPLRWLPSPCSPSAGGWKKRCWW